MQPCTNGNRAPGVAVSQQNFAKLLGAGLIREIREQVPDAAFEGVAGPTMRANQWGRDS